MKTILSCCALAACAAPSSAQFIGYFDAPYSYVAIAYDPGQQRVFAYPEFGAVIELRTTELASTGSIPLPCPPSNDIDIETLPAAANVGGVTCPAGTLLVVNGENSTVYAVNPSNGTVLATTPIRSGFGSTVGACVVPQESALYAVYYGGDIIAPQSLLDGTGSGQFSTSPAGVPPFDVFYGDIDHRVANNALYLVSSSHPGRIRALTTTGGYVNDYQLPLRPNGNDIDSLSGIAIDDTTDEAYLCNTQGEIFRISIASLRRFYCGEPDFNEDGGVDIFDIQAFFEAFAGTGEGDADFNRDGGIDIFDIDSFFRVFGGGNC